MDDLYKPCDFSAISGYPHVIPEKALEKLPSFQSNNVVDARRHVTKFSYYIHKWCYNALHEDVMMKLFILSFDDDDLDWFMELKDNQIKTVKELIEAFKEKWRDKEPTNLKVAPEMVIEIDKHMQELELHKEQERISIKVPEEPVDESVINQKESLEFEVDEYLVIQIPTLLPKDPSLQKKSSTTLKRTMK
jgi:hypothetical protein